MIVNDPELRQRMATIAARAREAGTLHQFSDAYAEFEVCCASIGRTFVVGDMLSFTGEDRQRKAPSP